MKTYRSLLKSLYFLSELGDDQIDALSDICMERPYAERQAVFVQGAWAGHFYVILDGEIEIWQKPGGGLSDSLAVCRKGQVIGENVLTGEDIRQVSAIARSDAQVLAVNKNEFETLLCGHAETYANVLNAVSGGKNAAGLRMTAALQAERQNLKNACVRLKRNIESLKQAMGGFSDSEALYRNALESLPDGIFITDPEGRIRFMNARLRAMFNISARHVQYMNSRTLLRRIWNDGQSGNGASDLSRNDPDASSFVRSGKTYDYFLSPILADNEISGFIWRFRDAGETRPLKTVSSSRK